MFIVYAMILWLKRMTYVCLLLSFLVAVVWFPFYSSLSCLYLSVSYPILILDGDTAVANVVGGDGKAPAGGAAPAHQASSAQHPPASTPHQSASPATRRSNSK